MVSCRTLGLLALVWMCTSCGDDDAEQHGDAATRAPSERPSDAGRHDDAAAPEPDASTDQSLAAAGNDHRPEGVAHCYTELSQELPATLDFWQVFRAGALEDRADAIEALADAAEQHPVEEELALLLGLAHLWRVAEPAPSEIDDMTGFINSALAARSELERAYELCPTDHRIPAWLGPILVNQGRALGSQATVDEGLEVLDRGIEHYPSFVLFSKLLVYADRPKDDPDFQLALEAITENIAICSASDPACSNHPRAAHNIEGASVFLGDVLTKAGDEAGAQSAYEMALGSADYASWDYKDLLEARLDQLDERIADYADDDADNDPPAVWASNYQCSICHKQ
jgi:tetratricopeptide (TPR) repeat protein